MSKNKLRRIALIVRPKCGVNTLTLILSWYRLLITTVYNSSLPGTEQVFQILARITDRVVDRLKHRNIKLKQCRRVEPRGAPC